MLHSESPLNSMGVISREVCIGSQPSSFCFHVCLILACYGFYFQPFILLWSGALDQSSVPFSFGHFLNVYLVLLHFRHLIKQSQWEEVVELWKPGLELMFKSKIILLLFWLKYNERQIATKGFKNEPFHSIYSRFLKNSEWMEIRPVHIHFWSFSKEMSFSRSFPRNQHFKAQNLNCLQVFFFFSRKNAQTFHPDWSSNPRLKPHCQGNQELMAANPLPHWSSSSLRIRILINPVDCL